MIQKFKVKLNGRFLESKEYSLSNFTISKAASGNRGFVGGDNDISSKITLKGRAYNEIIAELVDPILGQTKALPIDFYDVCCGEGLIFAAEISGSDIEFCEGRGSECRIDFQPLERGEKADLGRAIKSLPYAMTDRITDKIHASARYIVEARPKFIAYLLLILCFWAKVVLIPIRAILVLVSLGSLSGVFNRIDSALNEAAVPADLFHPAVLVRDYIEGVLESIPGATFQSSILNDPSNRFYNAKLIHAESREGRKETDIPGLIEGNYPLDSLDKLLDEFAKLFNAKWWIFESVLHFERIDFNPSGKYVPYDSDFALCYSALSEPPPAYARLELQTDALDQVGGEAKEQWYSVNREWNSPPSPNQKGALDVRPFFGMSRFYDDGINDSVFETFGDLILRFFGSSYGELRNRLVMSSDIISPTAPKLVDMDENGRVNDNNSAFHLEAIFDEFHEINNPRLATAKRWALEIDSGFLPKCEDMNTYSNSEGKKIVTPRGEMIIDTVEIDYIARRVKMFGEL